MALSAQEYLTKLKEEPDTATVLRLIEEYGATSLENLANQLAIQSRLIEKSDQLARVNAELAASGGDLWKTEREIQRREHKG